MKIETFKTCGLQMTIILDSDIEFGEGVSSLWYELICWKLSKLGFKIGVIEQTGDMSKRPTAFASIKVSKNDIEDFIKDK